MRPNLALSMEALNDVPSPTESVSTAGARSGGRGKLRAALTAWLPIALLVVSVLVPYWKLTSMRYVLITDDTFVSDVFGGEFPARLWLGEMLKAGEAPLWVRDLGGGVPSAWADPMTILLFRFLPPVIAFNVQLLSILLIASLGTYACARSFRLTRASSMLAALGYSYSGFMVCQLKHVSEVEIAALFPVGVLLLEHGLGRATQSARPIALRANALVWFGFVVGLQMLATFPQSTYYCFLAYAGFGLSRIGMFGGARRRGRALLLLVLTGIATVIGLGMGAAAFLPLTDLAAWSERSNTSYEWIRHFAYDWASLLNFFVPYANGDISDGTYRIKGVFWEEYGYVGLLTIALAGFVLWAGRRLRLVRIHAVLLFSSFLLVLGPALPGFELVFNHFPGMKNFRFTTRAMFLVEFALCMLAAHGLDIMQRGSVPGSVRVSLSRWGAYLAPACVMIVFADLVFHQMRQNAFGETSTFLAQPETATYLKPRLKGRRVYALRSRAVHRMAFEAARGWSDVRPYARILPMLEPNTNLYWGVSSAEVYTGLPLASSGRWWGNSNHPGLMDSLEVQSREWVRVLVLHAISHVISLPPLPPGELRQIAGGAVNLYEVPHSLPRAYVATRVRVASATDDPIDTLLAEDFEPGRDVLVDANNAAKLGPGPTAADGAPKPRVKWVDDRNTHIALDLEAPNGGVLVLTDNFVPIWQARVDGIDTPIVGANFGQRGIALPPGAKRVELWVEWPAHRLGVQTSLGAALLLVALAVRVRFAVHHARTRQVRRTALPPEPTA